MLATATFDLHISKGIGDGGLLRWTLWSTWYMALTVTMQCPGAGGLGQGACAAAPAGCDGPGCGCGCVAHLHW